MTARAVAAAFSRLPQHLLLSCRRVPSARPYVPRCDTGLTSECARFFSFNSVFTKTTLNMKPTLARPIMGRLGNADKEAASASYSTAADSESARQAGAAASSPSDASSSSRVQQQLLQQAKQIADLHAEVQRLAGQAAAADSAATERFAAAERTLQLIRSHGYLDALARRPIIAWPATRRGKLLLVMAVVFVCLLPSLQLALMMAVVFLF